MSQANNLKWYKENPFAWPGGYQLNALMGDGETLCFDCVTTEEEVYEGENPPQDGNDPAWQFVTAEVYWEGPPIQCAHCNKELRSEYGDPDEPQNAANDKRVNEGSQE